ncbi:MAG: right-handed parallel beta-helix repeat-containing protein [Kiritimatiellales bacterium]
MRKLIFNIFCIALISTAPAETAFNLPQFIAGELAAGKKEIVIPPGRYTVTPVRKQHLLFANLSDVTVIAAGVEMVCTETTRAITVQNCTNVTIRGMTIDYDPLPFTQGKITAISADKLTYDIELFDGFPPVEKIVAVKYEMFEADGTTYRCDEYAPFRIEPLGGKKLRLIKSRDKKAGEQVGDIILLDTEDTLGGRNPHAVYTENSKNIRFEKMILYASNCFGFLEVGCDRTVYQDCVIDRRAPESDPVQRGHFRVRSLNADGYHSKAAIHGPQILNCTAHFQGDDAINITGSYHFIAGTERGELIVLAHRSMDIQAGDCVEVIDFNGRPLPDAKVVSIRLTDAALPEEVKLTQSLSLVGMLLRQRYIVKLDQQFPVNPGAIICSRERVGDQFKVIGCHFTRNRSRGILVKASYGEIRDTTIEHCGMAAFLIAPSYEWLEGGFVRNLTVQNCTVNQSRRAAVEIHGLGEFPGHKKLLFSGNTFNTANLPALSIECVEDARFENNTLNGRLLTNRLPEVQVKFSKNITFR